MSTDSTEDERDWVKPGAQAVILQPYDGAALQAETVTIERVLKRDVVLSNGERFNAQRLDKNVGAWGMTIYLVPPDDPRVAETLKKIRVIRAKYRAMAAYDDWWRGKVTPDAVVAAFRLLLEVQADQ